MKTYQIKKLAGISLTQFYNELALGGNLVIYGYCISILAITFRRTSSPYLIKPGEPLSKYRLQYNILSLVFGWWGFPWGPIYTVDMLRINAKNGGGMDITAEVLYKIKAQYADTAGSHVFAEDISVDYADRELVY